MDKTVAYLAEWAGFILTLFGVYKFIDHKLVKPAVVLRKEIKDHEEDDRREFEALQSGFAKAEKTMERVEFRQGEQQRQLNRMEAVLATHGNAIQELKLTVTAHDVMAAGMREDVREMKEDVKTILKGHGGRK